MTRTMTAVVSLGSLLWLSTAATAQQPPMPSDCNRWIATIDNDAGVRVDEAGYNARLTVEEIAKMCSEGKMEEARKAATETIANLGIKQ